MNSLFLDTSSGRLSLLIMKDGNVVFKGGFDYGRKTAEEIIPLIKEEAGKAGLSFSGFDRIYTTTGPGSYTGERISLTIAKVYAFLKPAVSVYLMSTLRLLSFSSSASKALCLLDARNGAYFAGLYLNGRLSGEEARLEHDDIAALLKSDPGIGLAVLPEQALAAGQAFPGVEIAEAAIADLFHKAERFFDLCPDPLKIRPDYLRGRHE